MLDRRDDVVARSAGNGLARHDAGEQRIFREIFEIAAAEGIAVFQGIFQHSIDAKGRTSLPAKFREQLAAAGTDKLFITRDLIDPYWTDAGFLLALERFGYDVTDTQKAVIAFQRRFRPDLIDGIIDGECRAKLLALLLPRPQ